MQSRQILIDQRFLLVPDKHLLVDQQTGSQNRLEPRLARLLLLLADAAGETVSRDRIIREIWNDYGGAEDGLNQAISFLRKLLDDTGKERIRTIPKKGYLLQASVSIISGQEQLPPFYAQQPGAAPVFPVTSYPSAQRRIITSLIIAAIVIAALFFFGRSKNSEADNFNEPPGTVIDSTFQYKEMKELQR